MNSKSAVTKYTLNSRMLIKSVIDKDNIISVLLKPQFAVFSASVIFSQVASNMLNKNKRKILLFGNAARALVLFLLFFVKDSLAFVYLFQLTIAIVTQFYVPAETPLIPYLARKQQLLAANSVFGICLFGSILIGYVIAGPSIRFFGISGVFLFMSFLFVLAFLCIFLMPNIQTKTEKLRTEKTLYANILRIFRLVVSEFRICISLISKKPEVASSMIFLSLSQVIILIIATLIPDYAQKTLGIGAEDISVFIFAPAALGMILASLAIGFQFAKSRKGPIINFGIFLSVIVLLLFASIDMRSFYNVVYATVVISFFAGISNACIFIPSQTIIQTNVEDQYLSKVYGLLFAAIGVMAFLPIILAGVFADVIGVKVALFGIAILLFLIGMIKIFLLKNRE